MEDSHSAIPRAEHSDGSVASDDSYSSEEERKYEGPKSNWRSFTEDERALTASLLRLRDQDLALHLYNAHFLKQNNRDVEKFAGLKAWANKQRWLRDEPVDAAHGSLWVPPKRWTAWPLSPEQVPRSGEQIGPADELDDYTLSRSEIPRPSRELEEIMYAITLSLAKERFEARDWETVQTERSKPINQVTKVDERAEKAETEEEGNDSSDDAFQSETADKESETSSTAYSNTASHIEQRAENVSGSKESHISTDGSSFVDTSASESHELPAKSKDFHVPDQTAQTGHVHSPHNTSTRLPGKSMIDQRPAISTDDERSKELLRPTIRATLSRLDQLLMALHHARRMCMQYGSESKARAPPPEDESDTSDVNDMLRQEPSPQSTQKRPKGRPRKSFSMTDLSTTDRATFTGQEGQDRFPDLAKKKRGRPRKIHEQLDGETQQEMLFRVARLQKKALPFSLDSKDRNKPASSIKQESRRPSKRESTTRPRHERVNLPDTRDWSEVMGTAALVGFPADVISRATQRCTALFGEGMEMRSLILDPKSGRCDDEITRYVPEMLPDTLSRDSDETTTTTTTTTHDTARIPTLRRRPGERKRASSRRSDETVERPQESSDDAAFWCPLPDCVRHEQGFRQRGHLRSHLARAHKLAGEELEATMRQADEEEEMDGGVHVDGFMKVVKGRRGWRSGDTKKRERSKKGERRVRGMRGGMGRSEREDGDDAGDDDGDDIYESELVQLSHD
ncbi:MAG: hypothetical protein M1818_002891 [Claussenomyces sp. TS43310]|nr:MAG: hypothetical protein M1818_002891 [Claussenomyces sp. TS43310]